VVFIISLSLYSLSPIQTPQTKAIKTLSIAQGSTSKSIIAYLSIRGYNVGFMDRVVLSFMGKIRQGEIRLKVKFSNRIDFLYQLTKAKTPLHKITLIPGETKEIFLQIVSEQLDINHTKLLQAYKTHAKYPEASISADTYLVPHKMNETKLIKFVLASSERKYRKIAIDTYNDYNQTQWLRVLTIASIIQKEAASNAEMPLIASVIYNRLKKNMRLQMDGTLNYGKYSHIKVTPKRIKTDTTRFNTYKYKGLPHSPIGSVGLPAIRATLNPAKSNYLYFMRNKDGVHDFSATFKQHRKHVQKAK
jgi:UPF0755 protein